MLTWHWPQITFIALMAIRLLLISRYHGTCRTNKYNFWNEGVMNAILTIVMLYYGGFFLGNHP